VRPEGCTFAAPGEEPNCWKGRVAAVSFLGADRLVTVEVARGVTMRVRVRADNRTPAAGEIVHVAVPPEAAWPIPERDPEEVVGVRT
jgi:hypothetical protein